MFSATIINYSAKETPVEAGKRLILKLADVRPDRWCRLVTPDGEQILTTEQAEDGWMVTLPEITAGGMILVEKGKN